MTLKNNFYYVQGYTYTRVLIYNNIFRKKDMAERALKRIKSKGFKFCSLGLILLTDRQYESFLGNISHGANNLKRG